MTKYLTLTYVALLGLTACGSSKSASEPAAITVTASCASDTRVTPYAANMPVKGKTYTVQLTSTDPTEPSTGLNTWSFKVLDAGGNAVDNATVVITPWMPDHGHGPSVTPQVAVSGGVYTATNVDLFMPGVWQLTFGISVSGGAQDQAVVDFCIAG